MFNLLRRTHDRKGSGPGILPGPSDRHGASSRPQWNFWPTRRLSRGCLFAVIAIALLLLFHTFDGITEVEEFIEDAAESHLFPPLYSEYHQRELELPQHNPDLPYPEGREGKYLWTPNHVHASGWGNVMQEHLLNAFLAHSSGRAYVFDNYTWNKDGSDYTSYNGKLIPSRVPYSAIIGGPAAGGPLPPGDPGPRLVLKEYFDIVCPNPTVVSSDVITYSLPSDASAMTLWGAWVDKLNSMDDRCIEIDENSGQLFSIWVFGSKRIVDIWPVFSNSPILTKFRWSPLIESAAAANRQLISPLVGLESYLPGWLSGVDDPYSPLPGLLVLHVRRGDFADHCMHLATWSSEWNGFNQFQELPDRFDPPRNAEPGVPSEETKQLYMRRCFPSIDQIVERVEEMRRTTAGQGLRNVYIMTNGAKSFVADLKDALMVAGHFKSVASSRDLKLNWEQKYVAQSVDMLIGQRAQVLIGNGFSSLTSNIVMLRMANKLPPDSNRFW